MTRPTLPFVLASSRDRAAPDLERLTSEAAKRAACFWVAKNAYSLRKAECIERLGSALGDARRVAEVVAALGPEEREVLAVVKRFGGYISGALLRQELLARGVIKEPRPEDLAQSRRAAPDPVLGLCERLVLGRVPEYSDRYSWGPMREYPSVCLSSHVAAVVEPAAPLGWKASPPVEPAPESTGLRAPAQMLVDLEQTAKALEVQGRFRVGQGGALLAAGRNRLAKILQGPASDPFEPPDRVALDYALLCALGVVEVVEPDAWLEPRRAALLFRRSNEVQASEWIRAWMTLRTWQDGIGGVPDRDSREEAMRIDPDSMSKARSLLVWALTRVAHGGHDWIDLEAFLLDLHDASGEQVRSFYWSDYAWQPRFRSAAGKEGLPGGPERSRAFWMDSQGVWTANALLSTFVHLGVVERGRSRRGSSQRWCFRLTGAGRAVFGAPEVRVEPAAGGGRCLTIQPSHEILLYLDAADGPAVTTLGRVAARGATTGIVQGYQLTRESVYGALEGGMTPEAIASFLAARTRDGVPANVAQSLAEWSRKREAVVVRGSVALVANLPEGSEAGPDRAAGTGFAVVSARAAVKAAKDPRVAAEPKAPARNWSVDEHGVVVPGEPASIVGQARLRRFATLAGGVWRITRESVRAARGLGIGADQILDWLGAHLAHEVPPVLAAAIRNWAGGRGKVFLGDVVMLQVGDPKAFEALRGSERFRPFLVGTLSPGCLVVAADKRKEAKQLLDALGFALDAPCKVEAEVSSGTASNTKPTEGTRRRAKAVAEE